MRRAFIGAVNRLFEHKSLAVRVQAEPFCVKCDESCANCAYSICLSLDVDDLIISLKKLDLLHLILARADFSNLKRDPVPPELQLLREEKCGKIEKFYAPYASLVFFRNISGAKFSIVEVTTLYDLLEKYRVFTADAALADMYVLSREERFLREYAESIVEVKGEDYPRYYDVSFAPFRVQSNEFMVVRRSKSRSPRELSPRPIRQETTT